MKKKLRLSKIIYRQNDTESDFADKVTNYAARGAFIIALVSFAALCFVAPFSGINILSAINLVVITFDNFFVEKYFGHKIKIVMDIVCVIFLMLGTPAIWFNSGGFHGIGSIWILFPAIYCIFGLKGRPQKILVNVYAIEVQLIMIAGIIHPEYEMHFRNSDHILVSYISICGIAFFLQVLVMLQNNAVHADQKRLKALQEDITANYEEQVAANDEIINTAKALELANRTQRSFTASMNHELRAPLNGIEGCLQILLRDEGISDENRELVRNAIASSKTINQTVNDLLDYAKLEEGKFEIVKSPFDLRDVLDNVSSMFRSQAEAKGLKFIVQIPKESRVSIVGDALRIQQVMTNLVSNGIKYTKEGSVVMQVTTERGHLKFSVEDTGQGMDEDSLKVLFDPFTRFNMEENVKITGTGLGMNIVSNMVSAMKGTIDVESAVHIGTKFFVDIPIVFYDSQITYLTPREEVNPVEESDLDMTGCKILCVDDSDMNCTVFKGLLRPTNATVSVAYSGIQAIEMCRENLYDFIFLDHQMPEMDGLETLEHIRGIDVNKYKNVPIIMFTGNVGEEYERLYQEKGADGYLEKPIMYDKLAAILKNKGNC